MKKIYMHEKDIPTHCYGCQFINTAEFCVAVGDFLYHSEAIEDRRYYKCPLKSIENHDKEVKKKFLNDLATAIKEQEN